MLFASGPRGSAWQTYPNLKVGYAGDLPIVSSIGAMEDEFQLGEPAQREDLLRRLGVHPMLAKDAATAVKDTAIKLDDLGAPGTILMFLPCGGPGVPTAHLYLLRPTPKQAWRVADDTPLDCWWQNATYELLTIPRHSEKLVLAHHTNAGHGSGYVQDNMLLLGVQGGHFETLIATQEYKSDVVWGSDQTVEQTSTLQPFPDGSVEETRATTIHETVSKAGDDPARATERSRLATIERRRWQWSSTSHTFVARPFKRVTY